MNSVFGVVFYQSQQQRNNQRMNKVNEKYSYISHPNNLPLQINGKQKKRGAPIHKQDYNGDKASINEQSRSLLIKKIASNKNNLQDLKSVLPTHTDRKKSRPNSIKTFNDEKENIKSSGIQYLMHRTQNLKPINHKQKAHIGEFVSFAVKRPQKKHFASQSNQTFELQNNIPKNHKKTAQLRLAHDIYSDVYRIEKEVLSSKRIQQANLFRNGQDLGLQKKRSKKVSQNKLIELIGSQCVKEKQVGLRQRRQDWRTSNINFF